MARYTLGRKVGAGGMGAVFLAVDNELKREVALKLMPPEASSDTEAVARFHREVKLLAQISHPNIIRVYDSGEADGHLYYAMELVEGHDLSRETPGDFERARHLLIQAADGLAYLHERELYHRDIKPANFAVDGSGRVILLDFGLAKVKDATVLTQAGNVVGTIRYIAPELLSLQPAGAAADVYALACTAHELIAGHPAIGGGSMPELLAAIVAPDRPSLAGAPNVPEWFLELQARALAVDPAARPSAAQYRDALRAQGKTRERSGARARASRPVSITAKPEASSRTRAALAALAAGAALAAVTALVSLNREPHRPPAPVRTAAPAVTPSPTVTAAPATAWTTRHVERAARSFAHYPTDHSVFVDCEPGGEGRAIVEVGRAGERALERHEFELEGGVVQREVTRLKPDTDHFLRIAIAGGPVLISDYAFRTRPVSHRASLDAMTRTLRDAPAGAGHAVEFLANTPDLRALPVLLETVRTRKPDEISGFTKIALIARRLRNAELASALLRWLPMLSHTTQKGDILLAGVMARLPESIRMAADELPRAESTTLVQAGVHAAMRLNHHSHFTHTILAGREKRVGPWIGPEIARAYPEFTLNGCARTPATTDESILVTVTSALAELGTPEAAKMLGERQRAGWWTFDFASDALGAIGTHVARRELEDHIAPAFRKGHEGVAALAALQRAGPTGAPAEVAQWLDARPRAAAREAVCVLAASATADTVPHLRRALGASDAEMARLAAWGLARAAPALAPTDRSAVVGEVRAVARSARDADGLASWALARLAGAEARLELRAAFDTETAPARAIGLAWALAECGDRESAPKMRARAAAPDAHPAVKDALARAADRLEGRAAAGTKLVLVPAGVRAVPAGIQMAAGQSADVSGHGWWAEAGDSLKRADETLPVRSGTLALTALAGTASTRIGRRSQRLLATRACELQLSPWAAAPRAAALMTRRELIGFGIVTVGP
jgi:hypothetical protein